MHMLQREGVRKEGDGSAGSTAGCAEAVVWKASEKYSQF